MSTVCPLFIGQPNAKQILALSCRKKWLLFGGARGGGKSWVVRTKAKLLAFRWPGIKMMIVRKTYDELESNHIDPLREELRVDHPDKKMRLARYNGSKHEMRFPNGSIIRFRFCDKEKDVQRFQGKEVDVLFIDESTQMSETQIQKLSACVRGVNEFPKHIYLTGNPGGQSHAWHKRLFIDRNFKEGEDPDDYEFIQSKVTDNVALMEANPDYIKQLDALPKRLRDMWRDGDWNVFSGQFFAEIRLQPDRLLCEAAGIKVTDAEKAGLFTHVVPAFKRVPPGWKIYRSYDFGYNRPFSMAWWAVDYDGTLYRILEYYGCTGEPNEGTRQTPDEQFRKIREIETTHPLLKGQKISGGVADPAIWDASRGESVNETAMKYGIYFEPGDNARIPGWMQVHYRLQFDKNGRPRMYICDNCKAWIRTMPLLLANENKAEDLDTEMEDHVADEVRYMCMSRPVQPLKEPAVAAPVVDPLDWIKR